MSPATAYKYYPKPAPNHETIIKTVKNCVDRTNIFTSAQKPPTRVAICQKGVRSTIKSQEGDQSVRCTQNIDQSDRKTQRVELSAEKVEKPQNSLTATNLEPAGKKDTQDLSECMQNVENSKSTQNSITSDNNKQPTARQSLLPQRMSKCGSNRDFLGRKPIYGVYRSGSGHAQRPVTNASVSCENWTVEESESESPLKSVEETGDTKKEGTINPGILQNEQAAKVDTVCNSNLQMSVQAVPVPACSSPQKYIRRSATRRNFFGCDLISSQSSITSKSKDRASKPPTSNIRNTSKSTLQPVPTVRSKIQQSLGDGDHKTPVSSSLAVWGTKKAGTYTNLPPVDLKPQQADVSVAALADSSLQESAPKPVLKELLQDPSQAGIEMTIAAFKDLATSALTESRKSCLKLSELSRQSSLTEQSQDVPVQSAILKRSVSFSENVVMFIYQA